MRLPRVRLTVRRLMMIVAVVAVCTWGLRSGPTNRILAAARRAVPAIIITSMQPETFNQRPAWEVRGIDADGTQWLLEISASGEVIMKEPVDYGPPSSAV